MRRLYLKNTAVGVCAGRLIKVTNTDEFFCMKPKKKGSKEHSTIVTLHVKQLMLTCQ